jgi:hypothetical protein
MENLFHNGEKTGKKDKMTKKARLRIMEDLSFVFPFFS